MPDIARQGREACSQRRLYASRAYNNTAAILILRADRVWLLRWTRLYSFAC